MAKVLVIDDDPAYTKLLLRLVERGAHEAAAARTLSDGLRIAREFEPDAVLLDVGLPDGSGLDAITALRGLPSRPEIIVVTALGDADGAEIAVRSGAWDYICKGGPHQSITLAMQRVMEFRDRKRGSEPRVLDLCGMVGRSPAMRACFERLAQAAASDANVLITGESGTGKELLARAVHENSPRRGREFVVVDCAALPATLVESVLFGHKKGAFTGATESSAGLLEQADGGTLFLDEVGEMPLELQRAFLRALQEKRFRPVGSSREVRSDFRLVAATNRDLDRMVEDGRFREDLLFRLRALTIHLPPLRERTGDVRDLTLALVPRTCERAGHGTKGISPEFLDMLTRYPWPGNVRELIHALEQAVASASDYETLYPTHLPTEIRIATVRGQVVDHLATNAPGSSPTPLPKGPPRALQDYQREATVRYLEDLMEAAAGDVATACTLSGMSRSRLYALLKEHGVSRSR